jgi:hypothetical protein
MRCHYGTGSIFIGHPIICFFNNVYHKIVIHVWVEWMFIFFNVNNWCSKWARVERLIIRLVLIEGGFISEMAYEVAGVKLNDLDAFRGGRLILQFNIIRNRAHVKIIDWAPSSLWSNAHECVAPLESSTNKVWMLFGKSRCHQEIDEKLTIIRCVA